MDGKMATSKLNKVYAGVSLIFLAVLAISPVKDRLAEWRQYQNSYNKILAEQPRRIKPVPVGIKQIWNDKLDRVDRCTSCHLGVRQDGLEKVEQPLTAHPRIYHDTDEFGCTVCHDGQGLATTAAKAHDGAPYWEEPILPKE